MTKLGRRSARGVLFAGALPSRRRRGPARRGARSGPMRRPDRAAPARRPRESVRKLASDSAPGQRASARSISSAGSTCPATITQFGGCPGCRPPDGQRILAHERPWDLAFRPDRSIRTTAAVGAFPTRPRWRRCCAPDGRRSGERAAYDTNRLAVAGGLAYVGIERVHEVLRFPVARDGLAARGGPSPVPPEVKALPANRSLEAVRRHALRGLSPGACSPIAERSAEGRRHAHAGLFHHRRLAAASRSRGTTISTSPTSPSCRPATCCCWSGSFAWLSGVGHAHPPDRRPAAIKPGAGSTAPR